MAVSGRKAADLQGSVSRGSAEDFDHCCEPCLTEGQHIEAFRYCVDCQEYLCKNCVRYHQKTKVLKQHQLIEKDKVDSQKPATSSSDTCTEKCSTHTEELVKFFCPEHEVLGCSDCMTMDHRTCKLDYIPDKCKDMGNSQEYRETMKTLEEKLNHLDYIMKKAKAKDKEIDICHDKVLREIVQFRKEINDHLDTLQKKIETFRSKKISEDKQKIQTVFSSCSKISTDIKQLQSSLHTSKLAKENHKLFIALKQARTKLQLDEVKEAEAILERSDIHYTFERNKYFNNILSEQDIGKLSKIAKTSVLTGRVNTLQYLVDKDVNVRTKTDTLQCSIEDCAVYSHEKVVLVDQNNCKVKVVDIQKNVVNDEIQLNSKPWGVTVVSNDQIAVTVPYQKAIFMMIMTKINQLKTIRSINVRKYCYGIICHEYSLFVLCHEPYSVLILDLQGNVKSTIHLSGTAQRNPYEIAFCRDQKLLYITDCTNNSIVNISLKGEVRAALTDKDLGLPRGMLVLDDGSLLLCSNANKVIYKVSGDLKQKQKIADSVESPCCIGFNKNRNEVFMGCSNCDVLKRFLVSHNC